MTHPAPLNPAWVARVATAGVRVGLFNTLDNDDDYLALQTSILTAARDATLSDEDLYPLLARYWIGRPPFDWPPDAAAVARRCAVALAGRPVELELDAGRPSDRTRQLAQQAVIEDLQLTPPELLAVLADHWQQLARWQVPRAWEYSLLDIARQLLLEPVAGACIVLWSTLQPAAVTPAAGPAASGLSGWDTWSIDFDDDVQVWIQVTEAELVRLGQPALRMADSLYEIAVLLARARAFLILERGDLELVAASIVRTTGWPGDRAIMTRLSERALELALGHVDDMLLRAGLGGLADITDAITRRLMPSEDALTEWVRDPSFARLGRLGGFVETAEEMRHDAARWLNWTLADAAVEVLLEMSWSPRD
jgi:hypothetical protein